VRAKSCSTSPQITSCEAIISTGDAITGSRLRDGQSRPHIGVMHLDQTDEEAAALIRELRDIVESDHYPFSPRIRTLRAILVKLRPEPVREPLPAPKVYVSPKATPGPEGTAPVGSGGVEAMRPMKLYPRWY